MEGRTARRDAHNSDDPQQSDDSSGSEWDPGDEEASGTESEEYTSDEASDDDGATTCEEREREHERGPVKILVAVADFTAEADGDLSFRAGDEFELLGKGADPSFLQVRTLTSPHVDGHVPTAFVKELGEGTIDVAPTPEAQHSVEALVQAQRLPSGFRSSLLAALSHKPAHLLGNTMKPRLAKHGLSVADLRYAPDNKRPANQVAPQPADLSVSFELSVAQHIPVPDEALGLHVLARKARVAVMDGNRNIVGHIVMIRAAATAHPRWTFSRGRSLPGGSNSDNVCLLRFSGDLADHRLVVELSYVLQYLPPTSDAAAADPASVTPFISEVSCGWTHIELAVVPELVGKTHEQPLSGGTPAERATVDLVPVVAGQGRIQRGSSFMRRTVVSKTPSIFFKFGTLRSNTAKLANELPTTILSQLSLVPLLSTFRGYLLDTMSEMRLSMGGSVAIDVYDPATVTFLQLCSQPIALAILRDRWRAECKSQGRRCSRRRARLLLKTMLLRYSTLLVFSTAFHNPRVDDRDLLAATQSAFDPWPKLRPPPPTPFSAQELLVDTWSAED